MASIEDRITALEDKEAIRELTARYCHLIAAADGPAVTALFCDDGSFTMDDLILKGRAELDGFYKDVLQSPPLPFIQNHVIPLFYSWHSMQRH